MFWTLTLISGILPNSQVGIQYHVRDLPTLIGLSFIFELPVLLLLVQVGVNHDHCLTVPSFTLC